MKFVFITLGLLFGFIIRESFCIVNNDCADIYLYTDKNPGNYTIVTPSDPLTQMEVYCDEGWMTILSRGQHGNDELFFDKTWDEMEEPFGTPGQEFWFGLKNLFELTFNGDYELKIELLGVDGVYTEAHYGTFRINDNVDYRLFVDNYKASSTAEDDFSENSGHKFRTKDRDTTLNCASNREGPWWFDGFLFCSDSHLMGPNKNIINDKGIAWVGPYSSYHSLTQARMKIRPWNFIYSSFEAFCIAMPNLITGAPIRDNSRFVGTSSGSYLFNFISMAYNNMFSNKWVSSDKGDYMWLQIDLGEVKTVFGVIITLQPDPDDDLQKFEDIEVRVGNIDVTGHGTSQITDNPVCANFVNVATQTKEQLDCGSPKIGRYVTVQRLKKIPFNRLKITHVDVDELLNCTTYSCPALLPPPVKGYRVKIGSNDAIASAITDKSGWLLKSSSEDSATPLMGAIDGTVGTHFSTSPTFNSDPYEWFQLDLGQPELVVSVEVFGLSVPELIRDQMTNLEVRVGNVDVDAVIGTSRRAIKENRVCNDNGESPPKDPKDLFFCISPILGRYITVQKMSTIPTGQLHIAEIEVTTTDSLIEPTPPVKDCSELYKIGKTAPGSYIIDPTGSRSATIKLEVYCEENGWTNILLRQPSAYPSDFFNKSFAEYKAGFGEISQERWIGLDNLYELTKNGGYELRIRMTDLNGVYKRVTYTDFHVLENVNYTVNVPDASFDTPEHSQDLVDSFSKDARNALGFSTYDVDLDNNPGHHFGAMYGSGGWFASGWPSHNFFGHNLRTPTGVNVRKGIMFEGFHSLSYSMDKLTLSIRPSNFNPSDQLTDHQEMLDDLADRENYAPFARYEYGCEEGRQLSDGTSFFGPLDMTCEQGIWEPGPFLAGMTCEITHCLYPPTPPTATDLILDNWSGEPTEIGNIVHYKCMHGKAFANDPNDNAVTATCLSDGTWDEPGTWPICVETPICPTPPLVPATGSANLIQEGQKRVTCRFDNAFYYTTSCTQYEMRAMKIHSSYVASQNGFRHAWKFRVKAPAGGTLDQVSIKVEFGGSPITHISTNTFDTASEGPRANQVIFTKTEMGLNSEEQMSLIGYVTTSELDEEFTCIYDVQCAADESEFWDLTTEDSSLDISNREFLYEDTLEYKCGFGHAFDLGGGTIADTVTRTCQYDTTWTPPTTLPSCVPSGCIWPPPTPPVDMNLTYYYPPNLVTEFGATFEYKCQRGYSLQADALVTGQQYATCEQTTAQWSAPTWQPCVKYTPKKRVSKAPGIIGGKYCGKEIRYTTMLFKDLPDDQSDLECVIVKP